MRNKRSKKSNVQKYARELERLLIKVGIPKNQAQDCANNSSIPIAMFPELTVEEIILERLNTQKKFYKTEISDSLIRRAAKKAKWVKRPRKD